MIKFKYLYQIKQEKEFVGYVNRDKKITFFSLTNIMNNSNKDLFNRIGYIRKIIWKGTDEKVSKKIIKIFDEPKKKKKND